MRKGLLAFPLGVFLMALVLAGCRGQQQPAQNAPGEPQYTTTATVKDIMQAIVDPSADLVWQSVTTVQNETGTVENAPKTDEEWARVRHGAIALAEASNLLQIPGRHVARAGEKSEAPGVELEPSEMEGLINKDRAGWINRAHGLHEAATAALDAADRKDAQKVFEVGEQIERACENCHSHYWYPNEQIPQVPVDLKPTSGATQ